MALWLNDFYSNSMALMSNENREKTLSKQTEFQQLKRAAVQLIGPPIKNESEEILSWYLKKKENTGNIYIFLSILFQVWTGLYTVGGQFNYKYRPATLRKYFWVPPEGVRVFLKKNIYIYIHI